MTETLTGADPLLAWRDEFPITKNTNYLISNSLGAMPRATRSSLGRYMDLWNERGVRAWADEWWHMQEEVGTCFEQVLGVGRGTVSTHQNVAMASQAIVSCFRFDGPRNKIVYTEQNFPSVMYLYEAQEQLGARIVRVPTADDGVSVDQQRLLDAIDEETLLVPISHVLFRSSYVQDAKAIVEKARRVGAFVILDVFQSIGTLPLNLGDGPEGVNVHAAVGGALKFLCGGPGNCFLYVHPDERKRLAPRFTGWAAHKNPFAFSVEGQDYRDDFGRFLNGTPNVPAHYAGIEGMRIVQEVGLPAIREKSQRQTQLIYDRARDLGFTVHSPADPDQRAGHITIEVENGYAACQALLAEDIVVDFRPEAGIRFAPHFYTEDGECVAAVERLHGIIEGGEHQRFIDAERRPG